MADIIEFKGKDTPHLNGHAKCLGCKHEWIFVAPIGTVWLDCPACSSDMGRQMGTVSIEGDHWHCNCGNDLFKITPTKIYCCCCGSIYK